ncbi:tetratricopeptide repeat protein [Planktothrix sp. PCC 11201]|uniref:tetratricopeptide repeat protein n=1 Tax=Planktothrix sp. PCC 11201 TaxID=1729650 RepID=UPI0009A8D3E0|nr:tetratricopeptide repeat protein [Planktothrix sp. PCC 11201]
MKNKNKFALTFAFCRFGTVGKFTPKLFDQRSQIATVTILLFFTCLSTYSLAQNSPLSESSVREQEIKNQVENQVDNTFRRYLALLSLILLLLLLLNTIAACGVWFLLKKLAQQTASAEQEIESLKTDTLTEMERVLTEARQILYQLQNKNDLAHETLQTLTTQTALPVIEAVWVEQAEKNESLSDMGELLPETNHQSATLETTSPVNNSENILIPVFLPSASETEKTEVGEKSSPDTGAETPASEVEPEEQLRQAISLAKQGDKLFLEGDLEGAVQSYDEGLKFKPDLAEVWNNRGVALTRLQRYHEAIVSYERAIQLRYNYADAWNNRGVALGKLNHYEAAILSYQRAIDLKSNYMDAWNNRGFALAKLQKYDEAISSYNQAAKIRPDFYRIWYNKARCYAVQGQVELALENLKRATRLNPEACQKLVKRETDFDPIRQDKNFKKLNFDS